MSYAKALGIWTPKPKPPILVVPPAPAGYELAASGLYVPIVQGAFNQLRVPGLMGQFAPVFKARALHLGKTFVMSSSSTGPLAEQIEHEETMAILHPDTSKVPIWRVPAKRMEHPISAWRCWDIRLLEDGYHLRSAAVDFIWEGPVVRAHKRPVDPKYWDGKKPSETEMTNSEYWLKYAQYQDEMHDTFHLAGIWAVKTRELAEETAESYRASCIGEIHLWGRVAQFELGYRAEVCMIKRLYLLGWWGRQYMNQNEKGIATVVADLSRRYGCEVTLA